MLTREDHCRRSGVAAHLAGEGAAVTTCRGLSLSTPAQAFIDLAGVGTSLLDLVIAGDSLVKATSLEPDALIEAADLGSGGTPRARRAARLVLRVSTRLWRLA